MKFIFLKIQNQITLPNEYFTRNGNKSYQNLNKIFSFSKLVELSERNFHLN